MSSGRHQIMNMKSQKTQLKDDGPRSGMEADLDIDLREVYFLIMHFLSVGPCQRTYGQFWNELLEHDLLPRRYHAWYSRSGISSGDNDDNGLSYPLSYNKLVERYPHIEKDHLVKLLKQLILSKSHTSASVAGGNAPNAADVPTLLGTGSFSLLGADENERSNDIKPPSLYMRWPHMRADQVCGLRLREIGGFRRQHRSPAVHTACYAIAKPSMMVQKMQNLKKLRGHRNAVYCATYDRSGRFVITGSDDRLVKIWCMETAYCLASCRGHEGDITDLAVSSNNALVASASNDFVIRVWRLPDGLPISVLRGHTGGVTGIVFSPRPSAVYQLLSAADDGTCRLWDARYSQFKPRIFIPKPSENAAGKNGAPSSSSAQQNHQIFCCTFNASGTIFVTGSSDFNARVWNAYKSSADDSEQPLHEMDVLSGHENDVNYVQFSGCAVGSRAFTAEIVKEDHMPKFRNSWFAHDNIVTCSRDGSAIIWIPKSRRSHGKAGRWTRAYHLKVPPPQMPPLTLRGGPRQRVPPTPRGVNMIIWSLDNRFVLAAIMDCRICVWNAADGSLVHSLTGHTESTYVLDVHPFNPRMAMSAGYDGKTIVWDIWEGKPIQIYETGRFKLVDGKFSPDGTSIILSDDVGQLYILSTGQGESQKDAQYDQFFLGDYRPLIQDTHGNVVDQETQLAPYRRNMQDLLCDSSMIPYPEPYQSMYQRRRLGTLGIEWRPASVRFAVGPDFNTDQDFQIPSLADMDVPIDPLPEFMIDWEPEIEIVSDDSDSEFSVTEEFCVREDEVDLSPTSSDDSVGSAENSEEDDTLRRSKRKKRQRETTTSSGRRVKRKILDKYDDSLIRTTPSKKMVNGRRRIKKNLSSSKSSRPRRAAARNALTLFSKINGKCVDEGEEDYGSEGDLSESASELLEFLSDTEESDKYVSDDQIKNSKGKEVIVYDSEDLIKPWDFRVPRDNSGNKKRLLLKFPVRDRNQISIVDDSVGKDPNVTNIGGSSSSASHGDGSAYRNGSQPHHSRNDELFYDFSEGYKDGNIKWGGVKARTSKLSRSTETVSFSVDPASADFDGINTIKHEEVHIDPDSQSPYPMKGNNDEMNQASDEGTCDVGVANAVDLNDFKRCNDCDDSLKHYTATGGRDAPLAVDDAIRRNDLFQDGKGTAKRLIIRTNGTISGLICASDKLIESHTHDIETCRIPEQSSDSDKVPEKDNGDNHAGLINGDVNDVVKAEPSTNGNCGFSSPDLLPLHSKKSDRMYSAVYRRSRGCRATGSSETDRQNRNAPSHGTSTMNGSQSDEPMTSSSVQEGGLQNHDHNTARSDFASCSTEDALLNRCNQMSSSRDWGTGLTVGLRSVRNRRKRIIDRESSPVAVVRRRSNQSLKKVSWLMLSIQEGFRYIPQQGDEVVYLRQGHQEYMSCSRSTERGPWQNSKGEIRAVEFCKVIDLNYSTLPGSGDSCCKMILEFVDPSSEVYGTTFKLTLPEVTSFPDFLVERTKYNASVERNWAARDKCQVWWRNEGDEDGCWWHGRIIGVKAKDPAFPDSPWERFVVRYKSEPSETCYHSPWELHDSAGMQWEQPQIDEQTRKKLLSALAKLDRAGNGQLDRLGVLKLNQVSQKSNFLNRFPVPLSLDVIQARLENSYYRSIEALKHDIKVMMSNAESYFGKNADNAAKMKRLSDWFARMLTSL